LGVCSNHALVDGHAIFLLMKYWSTISLQLAGLSAPDPLPKIDHMRARLIRTTQLHDGSNVEDLVAACAKHGSYLHTDLSPLMKAMSTPICPVRFQLSKQEIDGYKQAAFHSLAEKPPMLSSNDVILAHLLRLAIRATRAQHEQLEGYWNASDKYEVLIPTNLRPRASLPATYFGCCIANLAIPVEAKAEVPSLGELALRIRAGVDTLSGEFVDKTLELMTSRYSHKLLSPLQLSLPQNMVLLTNWTQFDVYGSAVFPSGQECASPMYFGFPSQNSETGLPWLGVAVPLPASEGGGIRCHMNIPRHLSAASESWNWADPDANNYPLA